MRQQQSAVWTSRSPLSIFLMSSCLPLLLGYPLQRRPITDWLRLSYSGAFYVLRFTGGECEKIHVPRTETVSVVRPSLKGRDAMRSLQPGLTAVEPEIRVWESYGWFIIASSVLLVVESLLIFALVRQAKRRRLAETELSMAHERFRLAVTAGKAVGWDWNVTTGDDRWFGDLQTMFGISSDTYTGKADDFRRRVYAEDQEMLSNRISEARESRRSYHAEFRVVRTDGSLRWVSATGRFFYDKNGRPTRMLGMAVDITEQKDSEQAIASLSGRLIEAQEQERQRIAREIHDDYNQRLAMLGLDLEELAEKCPTEMANRLRDLWNDVGELGSDLHSLSHSLHPSTLVRLGLVAGVSAFCNEFSEQQRFDVDFVPEEMLPDIPDHIAFCLFRIVQEGVRNAKNHSHCNRVEVRLAFDGETLHLSISDAGIGFDLKRAAQHAGIGIRSMEERLHLVGGTFQIRSHPLKGTRIDAWVPSKTAGQRAS